MSYAERLHPWVVVRLLPKMQRVIVARFRKRSDAEGHMQALKRLMPDDQFVIIFDIGEPISVICAVLGVPPTRALHQELKKILRIIGSRESGVGSRESAQGCLLPIASPQRDYSRINYHSNISRVQIKILPPCRD